MGRENQLLQNSIIIIIVNINANNMCMCICILYLCTTYVCIIVCTILKPLQNLWQTSVIRVDSVPLNTQQFDWKCI